MINSPLPDHEKYDEERVIVNYPGLAGKIRVRRLDLPKEEMPEIPDGFHVIRLVINLKVVEFAHPERVVSVFDPPIVVRVHFIPDDFEKATKINKLPRLGFWNGKQWFHFTEKEHFYHTEPGTSQEPGPWGVVTIARWDDPTIAVGT